MNCRLNYLKKPIKKQAYKIMYNSILIKFKSPFSLQEGFSLNKFCGILMLLMHIHFASGQVLVSSTPSSPDASTILDIKSTDKGLLVPRLTLVERNNIAQPAHSLLIYQTDNTPGYYYNTGSTVIPVWTRLVSTQSILQHIGKTPIETLPYTISQSGSYYLTKSLTASTGITISASNVYIDLNGHSLTGGPGNNAPGMSTSAAYSNLTVVNGQILNWGKEGINFSISSSCKLDNLQVTTNTRDGILSGKNTVVSNCVAMGNSLDGIDSGESSIIENCIAEGNLNDGIECGNGSFCDNNVAKNNTMVGIKSTGTASIQNCHANTNGTHGFQIGIGTEASGNSATGNGQHGFYILDGSKLSNNMAKSNTSNGFELIGNDIVIEHCSSISNTGSGFNTSFNYNQFIENVSNKNSVHGFSVSGSSNLLIKNKATNNTTSGFTVTAPNVLATVLASAAAINANTNPNANISY